MCTKTSAFTYIIYNPNIVYCVLLVVCFVERNNSIKMLLTVTVEVGGEAKAHQHFVSRQTVCLVHADISLSCQVRGLLVTCSMDDSIKFWDIQVRPANACVLSSNFPPPLACSLPSTQGKTPSYLYSKEMHMVTCHVPITR